MLTRQVIEEALKRLEVVDRELRDVRIVLREALFCAKESQYILEELSPALKRPVNN